MVTRDRTIVGLDIGASSIKVVEIERRRGDMRLVNFGEAALEPDAIVDGEIMDRQAVVAAIRELFTSRRITPQRVVLGVHGRGVIVKKIVMDRIEASEAAEAVYWEAERHVSYDLNDLSLDFEILGVDVGPTQMQVLLVAAKRDLILNRAEIIEEAGLGVEAVDVNGFAVQNALEHSQSYTATEIVALLNIGADITNVNVVRGGVPLYTQDLALGGHTYLQSIQKAFHLSRAEVEKALQDTPARLDVRVQLEEFCGDLSANIEKSLNYLRTSGEADHLDRVLVCGGGAQVTGVVAMLTHLQSVPVQVVDPLHGLSCARGLFAEGEAERIAPRLAVSLGLALRKERAK